MILVQEIIYDNLDGLHELLDCVDADFTGTNGEEYYVDHNMSGLDYALSQCEERKLGLEDALNHIVKSCQDYYGGFEYLINPIYDNACMVTLATYDK